MRFCLVILLISIAWENLPAQTLTTNANGEQIIVYPDGSWRYFNEAPKETPPITGGPVEQEQYNNPNLDAEAEARARAIVRKKAEQELKVVSDLTKQLAKQRARENKELQRLAKLREGSATIDRDKLEVATRKLQDQRKATEELQETLAQAKRKAEILENAVPMTRSRRTAYFSDTGYSVQNAFVDPAPTASGTDGQSSEVVRLQEIEKPDSSATVFAEEKIEVLAPAKSTAYAEYDIAKDPRYSPPPSDCIFSYDGMDEFTQKRRRTLAPEIFFSYTTPELKPYLGQESLITAVGSLTKNGGTTIFDVEYTIRSQYANREFGVLPKGGQLTIKMVGTETVTLRNQKLAQGVYDPVDKVYKYIARYPITNKQEKILSRELVDQVRIMWGTGFEDYPIFEVNYFQRQLSCL